MHVNILATLGIAAVAAAVGGASGNWWYSLGVVGLALLAAARAAHVAMVRAAAEPEVDPEPPAAAAPTGPIPVPDEQVVTA